MAIKRKLDIDSGDGRWVHIKYVRFYVDDIESIMSEVRQHCDGATLFAGSSEVEHARDLIPTDEHKGATAAELKEVRIETEGPSAAVLLSGPSAHVMTGDSDLDAKRFVDAIAGRIRDHRINPLRFITIRQWLTYLSFAFIIFYSITALQKIPPKSQTPQRYHEVFGELHAVTLGAILLISALFILEMLRDRASSFTAIVVPDTEHNRRKRRENIKVGLVPAVLASVLAWILGLISGRIL